MWGWLKREQSWNLPFPREEQSLKPEKHIVVIITVPPSHPMVTNNGHGYGSNVVRNNTSTELSIHYALQCICGGTSKGLLSNLPLQPRFLSQ